MTEPSAAGSRDRKTPLAVKVGLLLWAVTVVWWGFYYSQTGVWLDELLREWVCLVWTTEGCQAAQKVLARSSIPAYHSVLFWVGAIFLVLGFAQSRSIRR
jgi:hypothetical protein